MPCVTFHDCHYFYYYLITEVLNGVNNSPYGVDVTPVPLSWDISIQQCLDTFKKFNFLFKDFISSSICSIKKLYYIAYI